MLAGALQLVHRHALGVELAHLREAQLQDLVDVARAAAAADGEAPGVLEGELEAADRVGQAALLAHLLEDAGSRAAAEDGVQDGEREPVLAGAVGRVGPHAEVDLFQLAFLVVGVERGGGRGDGVAFPAVGADALEQAAQVGLHAAQVEVAGHRHHDAVGRELALLELADVVAREAADVLRRAEDRASDGVVGVEQVQEVVDHQLVGGVVVHLHLLEDDVALARDLLGGEVALQVDLGDQVDGPADVFVHHLGRDADVLLRREGVEVASDLVHLVGELVGILGLGALEEHMLDEMREAALGFVLVAAAHVKPQADGRTTDVWDPLEENPHAVREDYFPDMVHANSRERRGVACPQTLPATRH